MLRIVSTASTARRSGQPPRVSSLRAAGSTKTRRRTRPAVALLEGVEHRPAAGLAAKAGTLEVLPDSLEGAAMVRLEHEKVVGALGPDPLGDALLAAHRVQRDDAAVEVQGAEQLGDGRDLVRLAVDRALAEHQPAPARPGADQVQRPALVAAAAGPADGLAVDRDHLALGPDRQRLRPAGEAGLERVRVDRHEDPSERVVRGMPFGSSRKVSSQARLLRP